MSSFEHFQIPITVDRIGLKNVLRALIHSILFLRHFGLVRPLEVEIFNIVYVAIDDSTIEQTVEEKIRQAVQVLEQQGQQQQLITIGFMEKRPTKQGWFIGAQKRFELACWEQWTLAVTVAEEANTEMALKAALGRIFQLADAKIDHIPPITAELASEFLYQISVPSIIATSINNSNGASTSATTTGTSNNNNMNDASYMSLLRRMLTDAAPPLLMG